MGGVFGNFGFLFVYVNSKITIKDRSLIISLKSILFTLLFGFITITSSLLYILHFSLKIGFLDFIQTMISRFDARTSLNFFVVIYQLLRGYILSFGSIIFIILGLIILILYLKKFKLLIQEFKKYQELIIIFFILNLENVFLNSHAITYSFARLKIILFLLVILVLIFKVLENNILSYYTTLKQVRFFKYSILSLVLLASISSITFYMSSYYYRWEVNYLENNQVIAKNINTEFNESNSIIIHEDLITRGYSNMLFNRGIYEKITIDEAIDIANSLNIRFIIVLQAESEPWNMYRYHGYKVIDLLNLNK